MRLSGDGVEEDKEKAFIGISGRPRTTTAAVNIFWPCVTTRDREPSRLEKAVHWYQRLRRMITGPNTIPPKAATRTALR